MRCSASFAPKQPRKGDRVLIKRADADHQVAATAELHQMHARLRRCHALGEQCDRDLHGVRNVSLEPRQENLIGDREGSCRALQRQVLSSMRIVVLGGAGGG
jgi:hypothetical protein